MSMYRWRALVYIIVGVALMIFGIILHIKDNPSGIWPYAVGVWFASKADNLLVWDHITKEKK